MYLPFFISKKMTLVDQARLDAAMILGGDFSVEMTLVSPDSQTAVIQGIHTKIHHGVDINTGASVNSKKASVSFAESAVTTANATYPLRNDAGEIYLKGHLVKVNDSTGTQKTYTADQWFPDEMLGTIVIILGRYAD